MDACTANHACFVIIADTYICVPAEDPILIVLMIITCLQYILGFEVLVMRHKCWRWINLDGTA